MTEPQVPLVAWTQPGGPLGELTRAAALRAAALAVTSEALERAAASAGPVASFAAVLRRPDVAVIAELKRRSPSKGLINDALRVPERAAEYVRSGVAALSVLTEPTRFGGSLDDLRSVRASVQVPVLRKDFIVDRLQILEARSAGASSVLLIARALPPLRLEELVREAHSIGLDVLLEVRDERELERAIGIERAVIGVNNRDLETLALDDSVSARLMPLVPVGRIVVYESGIRHRADVERAASFGADAVLVGSSLSAAVDGAAAAASLIGVRRVARAG